MCQSKLKKERVVVLDICDLQLSIGRIRIAFLSATTPPVVHIARIFHHTVHSQIKCNPSYHPKKVRIHNRFGNHHSPKRTGKHFLSTTSPVRRLLFCKVDDQGEGIQTLLPAWGGPRGKTFLISLYETHNARFQLKLFVFICKVKVILYHQDPIGLYSK